MQIGLSLKDLGGRLSYSSLAAFLSNAGPSTAYARAKIGNAASWMDGTRTSTVLADLFDLVSNLRSEHAAAHGAEIEPMAYPRSPMGDEEPAMTSEEFDRWMMEVINDG